VLSCASRRQSEAAQILGQGGDIGPELRQFVA
jgi:hypothetical protein